MTDRWAVVVSYACQQELVVEQLAASAFRYFFPKLKRTVRRRGVRSTRLEPLLFNYVPVVMSDGWERIFDMRGVEDVIEPAREAEILRLKAMCDAEGVMKLRPDRFRRGEAVTPAKGPLAGQRGQFDGGDHKNFSEAALFNILGSARRIVFDPGVLVAA